MSKRHDDMMFFVGLLVGAMVGGIVAILLAPHSGSETREQVVERGLELKNHAEDVVQRAHQIAAEAVAKVQANTQQGSGAGDQGSAS